MDLLSPEIVVFLFLVGTVAGFVDSVAGGGGLICLPALLWTGLPPAQALATNKLQGSFGTFSAALAFVRKGHVSLKDMRRLIAFTFVGSAAGTIAVQFSDAAFLNDVMPWLLVAVALYFLLSPRVGDLDAHKRMDERLFALVFGLGLGFYDGFFGPGTGSFFAIAYVALLGHNLRKATAHTKVANFTSNIASLAFFILGGQVVWSIGLVMAAGQFIGARFGSHQVITRGARLVRPLLVVVSLAMTARLMLAEAPPLAEPPAAIERRD